MGKILATHTGSLIRPPELLAFLAAGERGESYDEAAYAETLSAAVQDVVNRQIDAGIDIVDDGEMGKASWITYLYERVSGLEARVMTLEGASMLPPSRDRQQFPGAYAALDALDEAAVRESNRAADSSEHDDEPASNQAIEWVCTGPITYDRGALDRDIATFALRSKDMTTSRRSCRWSPRQAPTGSGTSTTGAKRSSSTAWRTPCVRSTERSSTPASSSRSTTPS